jgi:translation initiation factor 2B subunit (eIF-2B alpha/beta/delta family)
MVRGNRKRGSWKIAHRGAEGKNKVKSKKRARVERMFGHMINTIRSIVIERARLHISMKNLAYNMQRHLYMIPEKNGQFQPPV